MALKDTLEELNNLDLASLDFSRVGVWPLAGRVALLVIISAVIIGGGYFFAIKDRYQTLEIVERKETTLFAEFERKAFQAANLDDYREQLRQMNESFGALLQQLPKQTEVAGLIDDIDDFRHGAGLTQKEIDLQDERVGEFYVELPIQIEVEGGYHEFGNFISSVAGMPRIVTLHDFEIQASKDNSNLLTMTVEARTYRYKDEEDGQ
ncbi:type 4a pilus biogenesis protein PilO [Biformimicrobium ophioploci]|uniref:Type 4a pilus biogenesis protein PilO n=1 Tax=Biformimicrobium ophioploci TaxID=3036711 RepID=A0ABQ6LUX8_9GAMM|nr:type 4a pilus biogenesis protein PilO [Microbulbifer sp. NKW57]GMG85901.1 type 4a pilus biogenesis protein PilO [Microbulbifer sp. NKW57]